MFATDLRTNLKRLLAFCLAVTPLTATSLADDVKKEPAKSQARAIILTKDGKVQQTDLSKALKEATGKDGRIDKQKLQQILRKRLQAAGKSNEIEDVRIEIRRGNEAATKNSDGKPGEGKGKIVRRIRILGEDGKVRELEGSASKIRALIEKAGLPKDIAAELKRHLDKEAGKSNKSDKTKNAVKRKDGPGSEGKQRKSVEIARRSSSSAPLDKRLDALEKQLRQIQKQLEQISRKLDN